MKPIIQMSGDQLYSMNWHAEVIVHHWLLYFLLQMTQLFLRYSSFLPDFMGWFWFETGEQVEERGGQKLHITSWPWPVPFCKMQGQKNGTKQKQKRVSQEWKQVCTRKLRMTEEGESSNMQAKHGRKDSTKPEVSFSVCSTTSTNSHGAEQWMWQLRCIDEVICKHTTVTKLKLFGPKEEWSIVNAQIQLLELKSSSQTRNLAVVMDSDLNFQSHIQTVTKPAFYQLKNNYQ